MTWKDNVIKWKENASGHYEVWFLIFHEPKTKDGFWIRYTLMKPNDITSLATGALWFSYFNSKDHAKNIAQKVTYPREKINCRKEEFYIEIGKGFFDSERAMGEVKANGHRILWDLTFPETARKTHQHIPALIRKFKLASTTYCSPNLAFYLNGKIKIDDTIINLKNAPGTQAHVYGSKYGAGWAWGHCNFFEDNRRAVLELLSSKLKPDGRQLSTFYLKTENQEFKLNSIIKLLKNQGNYDLTKWNFTGIAGKFKINGVLNVNKKDLIGVEYLGPTGKRMFCYNSELASCEIEILRKEKNEWKSVDKLISKGTTAFETCYPEKKKDIPISIPW
ncbi:MAG: hypothetical protein ACTSRW_07700 [Candidatus Helarchaeota archaeon]